MKPDYDCNIDDLKFCYVIKENGINKFFELDIKLKNIFFPKEYKRIMSYIFNGFCILLLISIVAGECLFVQEFCRYTRMRNHLSIDARRIKDIFWGFGIILLMGLLFLIVIFVCHG